MQTKDDLEKKLKLKFEGFERNVLKYKEDIEKLANKMLLLQNYGLSKMNDRLIQQTKIPKFLEMLTEINFTAGLLTANNVSEGNIFYERKENSNNTRPIDLDI